MPLETQLDAIIAYLQAGRNAHDPNVLKRRLLIDGMPPDLIDQALIRVYGASSSSMAINQAALVDPAPHNTAAPPTPWLPAEDRSDNAVTVDRIRRYLEQHQNTHARETLQLNLLGNGYSSEAVDLAMAQVYGLQMSSTLATSDAPSSRAPFLVPLFVVLKLNFVAGCVSASALFAADSTRGVVLIAVLILLETAMLAYFWRRNLQVARGFKWALIGSLPTVVAGFLLGAIAVISSRL